MVRVFFVHVLVPRYSGCRGGSYFSPDPKLRFIRSFDPIRMYYSPNPSNNSNLYCDPNTKYFQLKILEFMHVVTNLLRLKESIHFDQIQKPKFGEHSDKVIKCNLSSGE